MADQSPWSAVAVAFVGVAGTLAGAALGYQTGSISVDKDYVQIAMNNLNNDKSSPAMREWSVKILNKLSPVPMNTSLKKELISTVYIQPTPIPLPKFTEDRCPDLIKLDKGDFRNPNHHDEMDRKFITEYEECRIKFDSIIKYIKEINAVRVQPNDAANP